MRLILFCLYLLAITYIVYLALPYRVKKLQDLGMSEIAPGALLVIVLVLIGIGLIYPEYFPFRF